jgi:hypothetical protein
MRYETGWILLFYAESSLVNNVWAGTSIRLHHASENFHKKQATSDWNTCGRQKIAAALSQVSSPSAPLREERILNQGKFRMVRSTLLRVA